jgi:hypothetical protein
LRPSPPLRTVRASFPAYGSSLHNRSSKRTGRQRRFVGFTIRDWGQRTSVGGCTRATGLRHLLFLLSCLINLSRDGRPRGSLLACAPGTRPVSRPLQRGLRFFRDPIPALPSACLTARFPGKGGVRAYHVPNMYPDGLGPRLYAGDHFVCGRTYRRVLLRVTYLLVQAFCLQSTAP